MSHSFALAGACKVDLRRVDSERDTGAPAQLRRSLSHKADAPSEPVWSPEALLGLAACARASEGGWLSFRDAGAETMVVSVDRAQNGDFAARPLLATALRAVAVDGLARQFAQRNPNGLGVSLFGQLCTRGVRLSHELRWVDLDTRRVARFKRSRLPVMRGHRQRTAPFDHARWCSTLLRGFSPFFCVLGEVWASHSQASWTEALGALSEQLPPGSEVVAFRPSTGPLGRMQVGGENTIVTFGNCRYPTLRPLTLDATRRRQIGMGAQLAPEFAPSVHHLQVV